MEATNQLRLPIRRHATTTSVILEDNTAASNDDTAVHSLCPVCSVATARYTCPRCQTPYCSIACYRSHNDTGCSESFYRHCVGRAQETERKGDESMPEILARQYEQQQQQLVPYTDETSRLVGGLERQDLVDLLFALEKCETDNRPEKAGDELHQLLRQKPKIQAAVQSHLLNDARAMENLVQEWMLEPWHPWWRCSVEKLAESFEEESANAMADTETESATLDEWILALKPFPKLFPVTSSSTLPPLQYNCVDLVGAILYTLRLYHGVANITSDASTWESAAQSLVESSTVLGRDARYTSYAELCDKTILSQPDELLRGDVNIVLHCDRLVMRTLREGSCVLKRNKRMSRKVLFYASWIQHQRYGQNRTDRVWQLLSSGRRDMEEVNFRA